MEISLEKIELVKDRTGVSYKEAKEALIKSEGNVVEAIIMIEDEIDIAPKTKAGNQAYNIVDKVKQLVKKGNISKIMVKRGEDVILNVPVNLGLLGVICVPWVTLFSTVLALGVKCNIFLVKDNGEIIDINEKANETFGGVKDNCSVIADDIKEKSSEAFSQVKDKAVNVVNKAKSGLEEYTDDIDWDDDYFNFDDFDDSVLEEDETEKDNASVEPETVQEKEKDSIYEEANEDDSVSKPGSLKEAVLNRVDKAAETVGESIEDAISNIKDKSEDIKEALEDKAEYAADKFEDLTDAAPVVKHNKGQKKYSNKKNKGAKFKERSEYVSEKLEDMADTAKDKLEDIVDAAEDKKEYIKDRFEDIREDAADWVEGKADKIEDSAESTIDKASEKFEEMIHGYKEKKNRFKFFDQ